MKHTCNSYQKTILSHTFDYGKEIDTSITLPYTVLLSTSSDDTFASAEAITGILTCTSQSKTYDY